MNVWPFIEAERAEQRNVARTCALLEVSRSAFYDYAAHKPKARELRDAELIELIVEIHAASKGTYGAPRIHGELAEHGVHVGKKRVARLMVRAGIAGRCRKRWVTTTVRDPDAEVDFVDLIDRRFAPGGELDRRWCGDITYIPTWEGWAYLATVIDIASRRVVGWTVADHLRTDLVSEALRTACLARRPYDGVIFHSDRGAQYTSGEFRRVADALGVTLSFSGRGECWDNAVAESFFATLKMEFVDDRVWASRAALRRGLFDYIEGWYNLRRRHSSLGYRSPARYEAIHEGLTAPAA